MNGIHRFIILLIEGFLKNCCKFGVGKYIPHDLTERIAWLRLLVVSILN
jgi:hypothetical protein